MGVYDDEYISQFRQEGQAAAALIHPNIVGLHAIGYIADTHFLEMEYVPAFRSSNSSVRKVRCQLTAHCDWQRWLPTD